MQASADDKRLPVVVMGVSASGKTTLGAAPGLVFVFLDVSAALVEARMAARRHHFMPASLAASQFATLERPAPAEMDVVTLDAGLPIQALLAAATAALLKLRKLSPAARL